MRAKSLVVSCLVLLTAFVATIALRIEYLNALAGHVFPRHEMAKEYDSKGIAKLDVVLERLDRQIFDRREEAAQMEDTSKFGNAVPVFGAPYSPIEQRSINNVKNQHGILTQLHWYIDNFGIAQHFLAPAALLMAVVCGLAFTGRPLKLTAGVCGSLSCAAIFLMLVRGYW